MKEINCLNTDNIICPYCGYEEELYGCPADTHYDDYECVSCKKKFVLQVEYSVSYTSLKRNCEDDNNTHDYKFTDIALKGQQFIGRNKDRADSEGYIRLAKDKWVILYRYCCSKCDDVVFEHKSIEGSPCQDCTDSKCRGFCEKFSEFEKNKKAELKAKEGDLPEKEAV